MSSYPLGQMSGAIFDERALVLISIYRACMSRCSCQDGQLSLFFEQERQLAPGEESLAFCIRSCTQCCNLHEQLLACFASGTTVRLLSGWRAFGRGVAANVCRGRMCLTE